MEDFSFAAVTSNHRPLGGGHTGGTECSDLWTWEGALASLYKSELLDRVVPFWLNKSQDTEFGGYFTCLDRDGNVFDTDKFVWLQGREVWMFSKLYNTVEPRQEWLDAAIQGAEFLKKHGHDGNLNWYFALDREGHPLVEPYNIFSYTFAVIAFGQLSIALKSAGQKERAEEYASIAKRTFDIVLSKVDNPKGRWSKASPGARALKTFDLPMILCNVVLEIEPLLKADGVESPSLGEGKGVGSYIDDCLHEAMDCEGWLALLRDDEAPVTQDAVGLLDRLPGDFQGVGQFIHGRELHARQQAPLPDVAFYLFQQLAVYRLFALGVDPDGHDCYSGL